MQTITDNASVGAPTERVVLIVYIMFKPCVCPCFAKKLLCVSTLFQIWVWRVGIRRRSHHFKALGTRHQALSVAKATSRNGQSST
ncbi:MAG: hypothetical protein IKW86_03250 [Salinivirgaceae bacterium]|nr:hypothetical protein [Salinivirgaceae bacterium]